MNTSSESTLPIALVTGAPGWLGTRLVQALSRQTRQGSAEPRYREIRCLVQRGLDGSSLQSSADVTLVSGSLDDPASLGQWSDGAAGATVFHCAGIIHPHRAADFDTINAQGTAHVLAATAAAKVRRVVYVSSNSPFGANPRRDHLFTEEAPFNPYMGYGRSKMAAEMAVSAAHRRGDFETVIVRAPWFYGPGQPPRQTQFFTLIRTGKFPLVGDGGNKRSMAYVDNLCDGLMLAAESAAASGEAYWISDQRPYTMNEIIETVENVMERDFGIAVARKRMRLPSMAADVARVCDSVLQSAGLYHQKIHVLSEMNLTIACSVEKARAQLGYQPSVSLEEGMRRSLAWVLAEGIAV